MQKLECGYHIAIELDGLLVQQGPMIMPNAVAQTCSHVARHQLGGIANGVCGVIHGKGITNSLLHQCRAGVECNKSVFFWQTWDDIRDALFLSKIRRAGQTRSFLSTMRHLLEMQVCAYNDNEGRKKSVADIELSILPSGHEGRSVSA